MERIADPTGARGSNTGDQFHELWALEQALLLLDPATKVEAVTVEGIKAEEPQTPENARQWDGVDCALYLGGTNLAAATRVELVQLKYSTDPTRAWTLARLAARSAKTTDNSTLRRLANMYTAIRATAPGAEVRVRFCSNQPVADETLEILRLIRAGAPVPSDRLEDVQRLESAAGLDDASLNDFAAILDLSDCGHSSRFAVRERVLARIAALIGDNAASVEAELRQRIREFMLPERSGEIITVKTVLSWLGVADLSGLFPCPSALTTVADPIIRRAAADAVSRLQSGIRFVCVHGPGGCGKTTVLQELRALLPEGSRVVIFDCYGAGGYRHSDDKRHLPENAYLQLANELAVALATPFFVPRNSRSPADVLQLRARLVQAGETLAAAQPDALLVVAIDAADNSVTAARLAEGPCFVHELCNLDLDRLPPNLRLVVSARTRSLDDLKLPNVAARIECTTFLRAETEAYVRRFWPTASDSWIEQFHSLSGGIPRVQAYAVSSGRRDQTKALDSLRPGGKGLTEVLNSQFEEAFRKVGQPELFDTAIAALALLPPPIPPEHLAAVAGTTTGTILDLAHDLAPGVRLEGDSIVVADEDFEEFIRVRANDNTRVPLASIRSAIAQRLFARHKVDAYAAIHVADSLLAAGRDRELLPLLESDLIPKAISDPIARREVQLRRFRLALRSSGRVGRGDVSDVLKVVLISADAERDESALRDLLGRETDLAVHFAWPTLRRLVLTDRDNVRGQGSVLAADASRAARDHDSFLARERLASYDAWLRRRNAAPESDRRHWTVSDDDLVARAEAIFEVAGIERAIQDLRAWRPKDIPVRVALRLVPVLLARGRQDPLVEALEREVVPAPWSLLLAVPLAQAGHKIPADVIARGLKRLRSQLIPPIDDIAGSADGAWQAAFTQLLFTACELAVVLGVSSTLVLRVITLLRSRTRVALTAFHTEAIDASLRGWLLEQHLTNRSTSLKDFIDFLSPQRADRARGVKPDSRQLLSDRDRELHSIVTGLFPIYSGRLALVTRSSIRPDELKAAIPGVSESDYQFDYVHWSGQARRQAAVSVMQLTALPGLGPTTLYERATAILDGRYPDPFGSRTIPLLRFLLLRAESHNFAHSVAIAKMRALVDARIPATDKAEGLVSLSRLLLPVSRDDSRELFIAAAEIAKELDREVHDQIDLLAAWTTAGAALSADDRRGLANSVFSFVSGAAARVAGHYEGFPWGAAARGLATLAMPVGMSAIARWADEGTAPLKSTLLPLLATSLADGSLSPAVVTALSVLLEETTPALTRKILEASGPSESAVQIREEVARDCLLHTPPPERLVLGRQILERPPAPEAAAGSHVSSLEETVRFLEALDANAQPANGPPTAVRGTPGDLAPLSVDGVDLTNKDAVQALLDADDPHRRLEWRDRLAAIRDHVPLRERTGFLDAIARLDLPPWGEGELANGIAECVRLWRDSPAVDRWRMEQLPKVIVSRFAGLARWLKEGESHLQQLLDLACTSSEDRLRILTEGVRESGLDLGHRSLYAVTELVVREMAGPEAASLLQWYAARLLARIPADERVSLSLADIPSSNTEAVGRLVFSLLSDIDSRVRWRAAHVLRRLARMGVTGILDAVIRNWDRTADDCYRAAEAPFYWMAARLWLVMALNRIAHETPNAVGGHLPWLTEVATSRTFPHVLIREHAKRAALKLLDAGYTGVPKTAHGRLRAVNVSHRRRVRLHATDGIAPTKSAGDADATAFKFDTMDTVPYWYSALTRMFAGITMHEVLSRASSWITETWRAPTDANWWSKEPRRQRYEDRKWGLYSHHDGSRPVIERYGTYLEWHAMLCVAGDLLQTKPLVQDDFGSSFEDWLGRLLPTWPDEWLCDGRGPTPLEERFWAPDQRTDRVWLHSSRASDFLQELEYGEQVRPEWIVVAGSHQTQLPTRELRVTISSALISPPTAVALVRALQTTRDSHDFRIPWQDDDQQIREGPYRLEGWLTWDSPSAAFDENDPLRRDAQPLPRMPGRRAKRVLALKTDSASQRVWNAGKRQSMTGEIWSDWAARDDDERGPRLIGSNGWRLWINKTDLGTLLRREHADLIVEVLIERRLRSEYSRSYDSDPKKNKTIHRIFLCTRDGRIEGPTGDIGSWTKAR